ncbi:MAG: sulfate transporter permease [Frankiales bacterium]|jgi:NitT/TauT family transport system permease protein|nr:sulfate transporter permease [Frankiales bacterium]
MSASTLEDRRGAELEAGLDALELGPVEATQPAWRRTLSSVLPPALALLGILALWQVVEVTRDPDNLPGPGEVWAAMTYEWGQGRTQEAILTSLERGVLGFLVSLVIATPIGLVLARVQVLRRAFRPLISGLQSLPSVAWVPAAILWFGLNDATLYFVILMGAIPSIVNGTISGLDQVPPLFQRVGHVLGARGLTLARLVLLPAALPGYLGGLKQGWAFSWRSLMAAELIATSGDLGLGLGQQLDQARTLGDLPGVLAGILAILAVGIAVELLVFAPLEKRVLRRRGLTVSR